MQPSLRQKHGTRPEDSKPEFLIWEIRARDLAALTRMLGLVRVESGGVMASAPSNNAAFNWAIVA